MVKIAERASGKSVMFSGRRGIFKELYTPYLDEYPDYSEIFQGILYRYRNKPLEKYILTSADKRRIAKDPKAIENIPRYYIAGYDEAVGGELDPKLREEFYRGFINGSQDIVDFINDTNPKYRAYIE